MKPSYLLWSAPFVGLLALHLVGQQRNKSEIAELRSKLGAVSMPRGAAEAHSPALRPVAFTAPVAPKQEAAAAPALATEAPLDPPLGPSQMRDHFEVSFTNQRTDARSDDARRTAEAKLSALLSATTTLQSLECRTSMCRIETAHQGVESYQQFVRSAFINPATKLWDGGFFSTPLADPVNGKAVIVSYVAHDGEELPSVIDSAPR